MKYIFSLLLFTFTLFGASVDTKLYEGENRALYYDEIYLSLQKSGVEEELLQLARLKEVSGQKLNLEPYNTENFDAQSVDLYTYYNGVKELALLVNKKDSNTLINTDLQAKLLFLKKMIENITEKEKKKLLSYQLQFAYYKLQQKNLELKLGFYTQEIQKIKDLLFQALAKLNCDENIEEKEKITLIDKAIEKKNHEIILKDLEKEKALIEDGKLLAEITQELNTLKTQYQELKSEKIALNFIKLICFVKENKNTQFYKLATNIQSSINTLSDTEYKKLYLLELDAIKGIAKQHSGQTKLFLGATLQESQDFFGSVKSFISSPLFVFNEQAISIFSLLKALLYIVIGFFLGIFYKRWIFKVMDKWQDVSMMSIRLISNIGYYLIVLVFLIISISSLGIDMSSLSLIAGALSIGIGFGLQTVVSNLIAGIILMFERTIRIGDIIEINDVLSGTVTDMRIRSTTIQTFDNIDIVVPNSSFIQNNVINMTLEDRTRRLHVPFSVAYGSEIADVKKAVLDALEESDIFYMRDNEDRKADVRMTLMNSSSVDLELIVWVNRDPKVKNVPILSDFLILIYNALRANKIDIPFPQLDVYMKQMLEETKH